MLGFLVGAAVGEENLAAFVVGEDGGCFVFGVAAYLDGVVGEEVDVNACAYFEREIREEEVVVFAGAGGLLVPFTFDFCGDQGNDVEGRSRLIA